MLYEPDPIQRSPLDRGSSATNQVMRYPTRVSYQPTHEVTVFAQSWEAIARIRSGAAMSLFQASQQASTIASYGA